jgi:hypothetical protein
MVRLRALQHLGHEEETQQTTLRWATLERSVAHLETTMLEALVAVLEPQFAMERLTSVVPVVVVVPVELEINSTEALASHPT